MENYEKLGAFYLGKRWDPVAAQRTDDLVLYDSSDLTTHAVIIGMTGSGKTGLGIGLLEEAALDRIPVIAIDPKGDLGNLMLSFPTLSGSDLVPWVDPQVAQTKGQTPAEFAEAEAQAWRKGLADYGQTPERIARLRQSADFCLYTPGSTAGRPLAALAGFAVPPEAVRADPELYRQHLQGVVSGLLALTGGDADPGSREHILIATVLDAAWQKNQGPDLAGLISAVQHPGVQRVGALDLESFYPAKERFALAVRLNNLLAAPGFQAWIQGEPLDPARLLFTESGQPRVSVISIAHLGDAERMFIVTLLLNSVVSYMRSQPGTSSLRAILYMDEVQGYLPPVAAPPSKAPLLTLLKQARAFGIGTVLATQNPVDLDYKALSNAGTWFIGRLQTEQDRNRVRDGLLAASADKLEPATLDRLLTGLGKRTFLLHNVHESGPILFQTRTTLAYLRGPLTREDIRRLSGPAAATPAPPTKADEVAPAAPQMRLADARPVLPPGIPVCFAEPSSMPGQGERLVYLPRLLGAARVKWQSLKNKVDLAKEMVLALEPGTGPLDWTRAETLDLKAELLAREPEPDAGFGPLPAALTEAGQAKTWPSTFQAWLRTGCTLTLRRSPALKLLSGVDETEGIFRARLQQSGREARDRQVAALRQKYAPKVAALEEKIRRAEQSVEREREQVKDSGVSAAVSIGSAVLGALLGRKTLSATNAGRISTAVRRAGNLSKQSGDVDRASETVAALKEQLAGLEAEAQAAIDGLPAYDAATEELEIINLRPKASDVTVHFCGIGWLPHIEDAAGKLRQV